MKPPPFTLLRPDSLEEAVAALAEHGDEARPLAGGQSLVPMMNMRLSRPTALVDLNRLDGLAGIERFDGTVRIGSMVRQSALTDSADIASGVPLLARCGPWIGHWVTRNRGTVGGSIAHADARAELPVALTALGGSVVAASSTGQRTVPAEELFVGHFMTSLAADELVVETHWPAAHAGQGHAFEELALRHGDFALGMVACVVAVDDRAVTEARLVIGAVGGRPLVLDDIATSLVGQTIDEAAARQVADQARAVVEVHDELHASARYQRHLVGVLVRRAVLGAWEDAIS